MFFIISIIIVYMALFLPTSISFIAVHPNSQCAAVRGWVPLRVQEKLARPCGGIWIKAVKRSSIGNTFISRTTMPSCVVTLNMKTRSSLKSQGSKCSFVSCFCSCHEHNNYPTSGSSTNSTSTSTICTSGAGLHEHQPLSLDSQKPTPSCSTTRRIVSISIPSHDVTKSDANADADAYAQCIIDDYFMGLALEQAKEAGDSYDEVPIGALVVVPVSTSVDDHNDHDTTTTTAAATTTAACADETDNAHHPQQQQQQRHFEILSTGQNQIETNQDASAHAEMQALRSASRTIQNWRLLHATLYTTLEPCPMCLAASQAFRVSRIVYGALDLRLGAAGTFMNLLDYPHPFHGSDAMEVVGGVRSEEARMLLVDFFRKRRKRNDRRVSHISS